MAVLCVEGRAGASDLEPRGVQAAEQREGAGMGDGARPPAELRGARTGRGRPRLGFYGEGWPRTEREC